MSEGAQMSAADQVPTFYFKAKQIIPDLAPLLVGPNLPPGSADAEARLEPRTLYGNTFVQVRADFPSSFLTPAQQAIEIENTVMHEFGHPQDVKYTLLVRDHHRLYWNFRGFPGTWEQAQKDADAAAGQSGWQMQPRESWAECFGAALSGRWTKPEKTMNWGRTVDAMKARAFFQGLAGVTTQPAPPPPAPTPQPAKATVLWHLSHHSSVRPDGWSGAPDEARWIREELTPLVVAICGRKGIAVTTVDGDMLDHTEFHANYGAFCAPHYEADVHGEGGSFWGRAIDSLTPVGDDRLGNIFWRRYSTLVGKPPDRFGWTNPNVTDYYGFRLTSVDTPGILVEHGVGAPGAADHDWLRQNTPAIAQVWADALAEFLGLEDDDMFTDADRAKLDRLVALADAEGPRVWTQRLQDWLSKFFKSLPMFANADYKGPDVTTGQPRT